MLAGRQRGGDSSPLRVTEPIDWVGRRVATPLARRFLAPGAIMVGARAQECLRERFAPRFTRKETRGTVKWGTERCNLTEDVAVVWRKQAFAAGPATTRRSDRR
jgi:hypothetical protein